jgi:UDP-GlcNAc:undecaprenyl-phosphate GlcNAc-1-phosphate transferase
VSLASVALQCTISAAGALTVCALRMPIARTMDLLDSPDAKRKLHRTVTPLVGGLAVFPAIALACVDAVAAGARDDAVAILYAVVFGFFLIGYSDDRVHIRPSRRLLLTLALFAGLILMTPGLMPDAFVFGGVVIPLGSGTVALLAIVAASGALNAINMADGQDGLCTGLLLIWCGFLALTLDTPYANAATIAGAALVVVLLFNLGGLIFLGDIGAYGVGAFVIGLMLAGVSSGAIDHGQIVTLLTVPVVDCIWLMIERKRSGHSPFDPDRQHLHHILQETFGRWLSLAIYLGVVAAGAAAAWLGGWACVAAILVQAGFVALARLKGARVVELDETDAAPAKA